ncbi:MAG: four helix bundle protein [Acidobacteriales bacterium]|nr:four helix bundle protein [Terriglobales bacterium]
MTPEQLRQRTKKFAIRIIRLTRALPKATDAQVIGRQILRSGTSIGANYRAACRARSRAEFIAKLGIVIEEADETMYWLELLVEGEIVRPKRLEGLLQEAEELTRIFVAARQSSKQ